MPPSPTPDLAAFLIAETAQKRAVIARRRRQRRLALKRSSPDIPPDPEASSRSARQLIGDRYEALAWEFMSREGYRLLGRQLSCPLGELDLVVHDDETLVFIEVRYRRSNRFGGAAASITQAKQERLLKAIYWWLPKLAKLSFAGRMPICRIDFVAFEQETLIWHRDALRLSLDK